MARYIRKFSFTAFLLVIIGVWIWLTNLEVTFFNFEFKRDWPLILIVLGLYWIIKGLIGRRKRFLGFGSFFNFNHRPKKEKGEIRKVLSELAEGKIDSVEASERIKNIRENYDN
ncbi:MAG: hypothetical protein DDT42_00791 [candidate division WS2 bacterium]|uniref:LiaI-LiaF-like transmembrane region domain-containing protein n=1 Tax=Psychracetigena formicireducens TaxID=2986056 RepID=A0A9E2BG19_PSYF1|nr:hypothetical protein [Candidatus Psychracetigena formicireducens]MBT9144935.1 hypothetical protein [Candidatus Psychracetigena formicireducens]